MGPIPGVCITMLPLQEALACYVCIYRATASRILPADGRQARTLDARVGGPYLQGDDTL